MHKELKSLGKAWQQQKSWRIRKRQGKEVGESSEATWQTLLVRHGNGATVSSAETRGLREKLKQGTSEEQRCSRRKEPCFFLHMREAFNFGHVKAALASIQPTVAPLFITASRLHGQGCDAYLVTSWSYLFIRFCVSRVKEALLNWTEREIIREGVE